MSSSAPNMRTLLLGALATLPAIITAACTESTLLAAAETYKAAQASGSTTELTKLLTTTGFTYRQNNKAGDIKTGVLSKNLVLDHNKTITDITACASYTELISTGGPYVIGTQIRHSDDGATVNAIDTVAATTGDWGFNANSTLNYIATEDWSVLPEAQRSSRQVLQNAANAYLDMWSNSTAINAVPWGSPCARTEGGMHAYPDCRAGTPTSVTGGGVPITDRRYVIDETVGSCNVLNAFGSMPDSHEFRLVNGKLVLVHTITVG